MTQEPKKRSWRVLRGFLFICVCAATLVALFYAEEDWRGAHDWKAFKRQWEAKGEKFDVASFVPSPVPDDQNFALAPIVASSYASMIDKTGHEIIPHKTNVVNRLQFNLNQGDNWSDMPQIGDWAKGTVTDLKGWQTYFRAPFTNHAHVLTNDFPTTAQPQSPAQDVLLALSKYDAGLEELREASRLPDSRFPLEYEKDDPAEILLPHLAALKRCANFLQLRAIAELQGGQSDKAAADVKLMFRLIHAIHDEPFLISQLVRIVMLNLAIQPIYEGLAEHRWSDSELEAMDSELAGLNFVADYQRCMRSEPALVAKIIDYMRRTRKVDEFEGMFSYTEESPVQWWILVSNFCPGGWFRENQVSLAEFYLSGCLPAADSRNRTFLPEVAKKTRANLDETMAHPSAHDFLELVLFAPAKQWFRDGYMGSSRFAYAQGSADLSRMAIALERYKLAHGVYPESLDVLAPHFLPKLPNDVIGGQPLHYRKTDAGFVLYSVGWNEKDDGGTVAYTQRGAVDPENGDWVWSYAAK